MKMKLYHRLILVVGALITLLIGVAMIVTACGLLQRFTLVPQAEGESFYSWRRIAVIVAGAFLVLFGGYTMLFPGKLRYNKKDFIVQKGEKGDLLFSVKTLESLVRECVDMHKEIEVKSLRILPGKEGIAVRLRVIMASNISMPLVQDSLAGQIKQYVTASSGVQVNSVNVAVVGVAGKTGEPASPYAVNSEENAAPQEEAKAEAPKEEEKKLPHLRLFDKEEEQTVVPVPAFAQEAAEKAEEQVSEAADILNNAAENAAEEINGVVGEAADGIESTAEALTEKAQETVEGLNGAVQEAAEGLNAAAQEAADEARKAFGEEGENNV